ncbi:Aminoglycoside N(6')-acetyltransferase type 1 [termite gut metagenome]|uniref:Aminoglycoside N(6')-acetyltransferase type 1 n=1 Tax=termite gut metagenome TaxID=433724 RepID=A0A5J4Q857_9ZZZZ
MTTTETQITSCNYSNQEHLQAIITLTSAYIKDEMGGGEPLSKLDQLRLVDGLNNHPKSIVLLAKTDGIFSGLLTAFENFSTFTAQPMVNIHDVFVLKEYRGRGLGRQLMNAVITEAENRKCSRITLEVRKDNSTAQSLYKSLGFDETNPGMFYWRKNL